MPPSGTRVRVSKGQSKYGCFTCKSRRIKCDETKPACIKCSRVGISCAGYPAGAPSTSRGSAEYNSSDIDSDESSKAHSQDPVQNQSASIVPHPSASVDAWASGVNEEEGKLIKYATLLLTPSNVDEYSFVQVLVNSYINQSGTVCASARATAAMFGLAVQKVDDEPFGGTKSQLQPAPLYEKAVNALREELQTKTQVDADMLIGCILLLCAELALQRWHKALLHLQTLQTAFYTAVSSGTCQQDLTGPDLLFRMFDTSKLVFSAYTRLPAVSPLPLRDPINIPGIFESVNVLDKHIIETVHSVNCFISSIIFATCRDKVPEALQIGYYQHLTAAEQCLTLTNTWLRNNTANSNRPHVMRLSNTCVSTFLELSCLFTTTELIWDTHINSFEQVVAQTESILEVRRQSATQPSNVETPTFSLSLGIIQPAYFVALKCRHPQLRRRAIACLRKSGREGPWNGKILAIIAERCVSIEEVDPVSSARILSTALRPSHITPSMTQILPIIVPEHRRIANCLTHVTDGSFGGDDDPQNTAMFAPIRSLEFLRRRQADTSIRARMACSAHVRLSRAEYNLPDTKIDPERWEFWSEEGPSHPLLTERSRLGLS